MVFAEAPNDEGTRILRGSSELLSLISGLGDQDDWFGYAQVPLDPDGYQRRYQSEVAGRTTLAARAARHLDVGVHDGIINFRIGEPDRVSADAIRYGVAQRRRPEKTCDATWRGGWCSSAALPRAATAAPCRSGYWHLTSTMPACANRE